MPDEPAVDGPKRQLAPFRARPSPFDVVENPGHLSCGEVGVQHQPCPRRHTFPSPTLLQSPAPRSGPPVLPHNRLVNRLAGRSFPNHHRLALVRNADRRYIPRTRPDLAQHLHRARKLAGQDLRGVVLHPPRLRVKLLKLVLCRGGNRPRLLKENCAGTRRSLVQRKYVSHSRPSPFGNQSNTPGGF